MRLILIQEPSNPFNKFHQYEEDENHIYMRMIIPFAHAAVFAAIAGLAFGVNYRAKVVIEDLDMVKKLSSKLKSLV